MSRQVNMNKPKFNPAAAYEPAQVKPKFNPDASYAPTEQSAPRPARPMQPKVIDKMHPKLSKYDRWVVKNLASNPEASLGYLKKEYPDMEFEIKGGSEIVAKEPGEQDWHKLDESDLTWMDAGDVVADVGQGLAEGVAAGAAGIATMNPFIGAGAAGAMGAATEAGKQGMGSLLGIENNYNPGNIAASGIASAAMPVIGGKVLKPGWQWAKKQAPRVGEWLSGIPEQVLKNIHVDKPARETIAKGGITNYVDDLSDNVINKMKSTLDDAGRGVGKATGDAPVNISNAKAQLRQIFNDLPPEQQKGFGYLMDRVNNMDDVVSPRQAREAKEFYYLLSKGDKSPIGKGALDAATNDLSKQEMKIAKDASVSLRGELARNAPDLQAFEAANKHYSNVADTFTDKKLNPFRDSDGTLKLLDGFGKKKTPLATAYRDEFYDGVKNMSGVDIPTAARQYQSAQYFNNPSKAPPGWVEGAKGSGLGGTLGMGLGWATSGHAMGGAIGGTLGAATGAMATSPWAMLKAANAGKAAEQAGGYVLDAAYRNPYLRGDKLLYNLMNDRAESR
jgi:hypothetical protein